MIATHIRHSALGGFVASRYLLATYQQSLVDAVSAFEAAMPVLNGVIVESDKRA